MTFNKPQLINTRAPINHNHDDIYAQKVHEHDNTYAKKTDIPTIDDELTETSSNPVKSSGIYNGIKTMINAKFVVLTEAEYKAMASHDANTFYYIKQ